MAPLREMTLDQVQMHALAANIAAKVEKGDLITLRGEVGVGKTSFARAFIQSLSPAETEITSPTFTLMQSYDVVLATGEKQLLWHLDLYRLKDRSEVRELGLEELDQAVTLMEWPEIIEPQLQPDRLDITIAFTDTETTRHVRLEGNDAWRDRIHSLK